jgi:hypothetical protein
MACLATCLAAGLLTACSGCGGTKNDVNHSDTSTTDSTDSADTSTDGGCVDEDGDGHGYGCEAGLDCDDADPEHWSDCEDCDETHAAGCECEAGEEYDCYEGPPGTADVGACRSGTRFCEFGYLGLCVGQVLPGSMEVCGDGVDNDCNGMGDEEVTSACGDCDPTCHSEGDVEPDPADPYSEGITDNPDGPGVVLGTTEINAGYAWVANADEGTVSKLRLSDGVEMARYRVGLWGTGDDQPSRTAVDSLGNAYVASRAHVSTTNNQPSVTKMAGDERYCVDRNGDTTITTSTGPTPLPLGEDECVLWTVPVGGPGGCARALAIDLGETEFWSGGSPWVGMWTEMRFFKLDEDDGTVLETVDVGVNPYGAAIDRDGWIWVSGMRPVPGYIQRFHTGTLIVDPPISMTGTGCDSPVDTIYSPYGISIDPDNRVWVGSWSSNVCRYNPSDGSFFTVTLALSLSRGVAADADGTIWASNYGTGANRIVGFDGDDGTGMIAYDIAGVTPIGVGVDELGQVWTVNQASNTATRLVKSTATISETTVGTGPYTYSDFTGYQRSLMMPDGRWEHVFERCSENTEDHWGGIDWDVDTPPGTQITIYGFSADHPDSLTTATPVLLAEIPPDSPPADITAAFHDAGVYLGIYLRIVVILEPSPEHTSPVFRSVDVQWHCHEMG